MATDLSLSRRRSQELPGDVDALFDRLERAISRRRKPVTSAEPPGRD